MQLDMLRVDKMNPANGKFFMTFAYPTTSGALHVGHARSYTLPDIIAKYKLMRGHDVYFPIGFHATGGDVVKIFNAIKEKPHEARIYGLDEQITERVNTPEELEKEFERVYISIFKMAGFSLNYDTRVATIDEHYNKFIQWQFRKLKEKGYLIQKDYRIAWCPKEEQPVNLDAAEADIKEWKGARIKDYTTIKFGGDLKFMASTLRPETVFGVTNLWINPEADYVEAKVDGENQIISKSTVIKLRHLQKSVEVVEEHKGSDFVGKSVINPLTKKEVPIYAGAFVAPDDGTGIVMSVPGHDPFDYFYLKKTDRNAKVIQLLDVDGRKGLLVEELINKHGIDKITDEMLQQIKEKVYLEELNRGRILREIPHIGGMRVEEAKKAVIRLMDTERISDKLYDLSVKPIFCRCGTEVVVRAVKGQWFIDYGNLEWKALAKRCVDKMATAPQDYKRELPAIIDWLDARPCVRRRGFGTKFPFDDTWTIEALSDSTMYMAFYPVAENVNRGTISKEQLNDAFFDYIYLGKGDPEKVATVSHMNTETLNRVRQDFINRYPLDLNVGGIEHKSVHFPFFIFTHAAIFPEEQWPKGIFLNWHVVSEGEKMSKHKGNTVYWDQAINKLGSDAVRLYVSYGANQWSDFDWKAVNAERHSKQIYEFKTRAQRMLSINESKASEVIDSWLVSKLNSRIDEVTANMDSFEIRKTIQVAFYEMNNDLAWYENRGGSNSSVIKQFLAAQASMLYPFIPDVSTEVLKQMNKDPTTQGWPTADKSLINRKSEDVEKSVASTMEDIRNIVKLVKNGKEVYLYVTTDTEKKAYAESLEMIRIASGIDNVRVYRITDEDIYDPEGKAKKAKFMRPGIFIATEEKRRSTA